jgi:hypothetical protein
VARGSKTSASVVFRDKGAKDLLSRLSQFATPATVKVGILGEKAAQTKSENVSVGQVAEWAEFGLGQPERSWLRGWYDVQGQDIQKALRGAFQSVLTGRATRIQVLTALGERFKGQIQQRIAGGIQPANAPSTVAKKGSSVPLIDTGQLRASVSWKIDGGGQ